jgi:hypothetical protein
MRFKTFLLSLVVLSLFVVGCAQIEENEEKIDVSADFLAFSDVNASWDAGNLSFEATVMKPTPCHELSYYYNVVSDDEVEIIITQTPSDEVCTQVVTEEIISGSFVFSSKPKSVVFVLQSE